MTDSKNDVVEAEVIPASTQEDEMQGVAELLRGVVEPLAQAQVNSEEEATKRSEIMAGIATKAIFSLTVVIVAVVVLAGFALESRNDELAEKIVIGLFAFLGGLGLGKYGSN